MTTPQFSANFWQSSKIPCVKIRQEKKDWSEIAQDPGTQSVINEKLIANESDRSIKPIRFSLSCLPKTSTKLENNTQGESDKGLDVLIFRMKNGKHVTSEISALFKERAAIEEEFGKRLAKLAKSFTTNEEIGKFRTLRESLDLVKTELETSARAHLDIANEIRIQLEKPCMDFVGQQSTVRKTQHATVERRLKVKAAMSANVAKAKARYISKCHEVAQLSIPQPNLPKEATEKLQSKLERAQQQATQQDLEYVSAVERLADAHSHWEEDYRVACNEFQRLEEERIDYIRGRLWAYANIISTLCVSDDESCERIRQSLEKCNVGKDISIFIESKRTGSEIPGTSERVPPPAINHLSGITASVSYSTDLAATSTSPEDLSTSATTSPTIVRTATVKSSDELRGNGVNGGNPAANALAMFKKNSEKAAAAAAGFGSLFRKAGSSSFSSASTASAAVAPSAAVFATGAANGEAGDDFVYDPYDLSDNAPVLFEVRVLYDYQSQAFEELTVARGQIVPVIAQHEDGSVSFLFR
ncbi:hypothetical protein HK100_012413 [Physocladia obscura]|uniref:F-BAR domain-containing protein n=1 Tax=Physocladia obscura TaxID=109957 RepID=A0AAD5SZS2_9FUNG|nr:hypothetical protein HK100_012413 [Physocladia obscura]